MILLPDAGKGEKYEKGGKRGLPDVKCDVRGVGKQCSIGVPWEERPEL